MDGLVRELMRLEGAKHRALIEIDASAYDENVREQLRLLAKSRNVQAGGVTDVDCLLSLSQLITLNTRLLQNLVSITPWFAFRAGYTAKGGVAPATTSNRISIEA